MQEHSLGMSTLQRSVDTSSFYASTWIDVHGFDALYFFRDMEWNFNFDMASPQLPDSDEDDLNLPTVRLDSD